MQIKSFNDLGTIWFTQIARELTINFNNFNV